MGRSSCALRSSSKPRNGRSSISFRSGRRRRRNAYFLPSAAATARGRRFLRRTMAKGAVGRAGHDRSGRQARRQTCHSFRQFDRACHRHVRGDVGRRRRSSDIAELFAHAGRPGSLAGYRNAASALVRFRAGQRDFFGRTEDSGACSGDVDCGGPEGWIGFDSVALRDPSRLGVRGGLPFRRSGKLPPRSCSPRVRPGFRRASSTRTR